MSAGTLDFATAVIVTLRASYQLQLVFWPQVPPSSRLL